MRIHSVKAYKDGKPCTNDTPGAVFHVVEYDNDELNELRDKARGCTIAIYDTQKRAEQRHESLIWFNHTFLKWLKIIGVVIAFIVVAKAIHLDDLPDSDPCANMACGE